MNSSLKKRIFFIAVGMILVFAIFLTNPSIFRRTQTKEDARNPDNINTNFSFQHSIPMNLEDVLEKSSFNKRDISQLSIENTVVRYNPVLISVLASTKSRIPEIKKEKWTPIQLAPTEYSVICEQPFTAYLRQSPSNSPYTFIILPGFFSNFKDGSFINQTIYILNKQFNNPHIIAFDGYLSPSFLKTSCQTIVWDIHSIAEDIYSRVRQFLLNSPDTFSADHIGIIGFSGGGTVAVSMLGQDSLWNKEKNLEKIFNLGGIAFSPILHIRTTFHTLDEQHKNSKNPQAALSTNVLKFLFTSFGAIHSPLWLKVISNYEKNPSDFIERSFNELTVVDLRKMLETIDYDEIFLRNQLNYYNIFINNGFKKDQQITGVDSTQLNTLFDKATDVRPYLETIDSPFFIYFSQDDPFVTYNNPNALLQPVVQALESAETNPYITLFYPKFGGHTGALLDRSLENLIFAFFRENLEEENTSL